MAEKKAAAAALAEQIAHSATKEKAKAAQAASKAALAELGGGKGMVP